MHSLKPLTENQTGRLTGRRSNNKLKNLHPQSHQNRLCKKYAFQFIRVLGIPADSVPALLVCVSRATMAKPVDCRCELHLLWLVGLAFLILNSTDKRFVDEDFYNASHLTDIGANKFSKIVKKEDIIDKHHKR